MVTSFMLGKKGVSHIFSRPGSLNAAYLSIYLFLSHHAWPALSFVDRHSDRKFCIAFLPVQLSTRHRQGNKEHSRCFQAVEQEELISQLVRHCTKGKKT
jgi:hypothetical protein